VGAHGRSLRRLPADPGAASERNPGELTGYAVALPESVDPGGSPTWFGGGKLAADLTLPKLRARWGVAVPAGDPAGAAAGERVVDPKGREPGASPFKLGAGGRGSSGQRRRTGIA